MATPADHWCFKLVRGNRDRPSSKLGAKPTPTALSVDDGRLEQNCGGQLPNPVGLAAGFDKDGVAADFGQALALALPN